MRPPKAILETVIYATDLDAAERFYRDVVGLEVVKTFKNQFVFLRCGEQMLLIFNPAETVIPYKVGQLPVPPHGAHGPGHLCFKAEADELDGWCDRLTAAGVEIESDMEWPGGGRSIYFRDPAGNSLEFTEARIWGL